MDDPRAPEKSPDDPAGAGGAWGPSLGLLAVAVGIVAGTLAWWWMSRAQEPVVQALAAPAPAILPVVASVPAQPATPVVVVSTAASASPALAQAAPVPSAPRLARTRDPDGDQTPDLSDYVNPGEQPTMGQVIERLHQAGIHDGLGAFPPPGTRPPLVGLAVPEDFALPQGYVRHYQATDDGQRIEAILMFAPDRAFFDAAGRQVALPQDRVVPPELAPAGLPIRRVAIPAPVDPGRRRN